MRKEDTWNWYMKSATTRVEHIRGTMDKWEWKRRTESKTTNNTVLYESQETRVLRWPYKYESPVICGDIRLGKGSTGTTWEGKGAEHTKTTRREEREMRVTSPILCHWYTKLIGPWWDNDGRRIHWRPGQFENAHVTNDVNIRSSNPQER